MARRDRRVGAARVEFKAFDLLRAAFVWDSDPAAEYDETLANARALIDALAEPNRDKAVTPALARA